LAFDTCALLFTFLALVKVILIKLMKLIKNG